MHHFTGGTRSARTRLLALAFLGSLAPALQSQVLPAEWHVDEDAHMLTIGNQPVTGLYQQGVIRQLALQFAQPNYWDLLLANQPTNTRMSATLTVDGVTYTEVGVRLKGQPSAEILATQKWSWDIDLNYLVPGQSASGYSSIILDNASNDPSFQRQVIFSELVRPHIPVTKANFSHLTINGGDWGLYTSIQETNSPYLRDWFFSNNGSLWRADRPDGLDIGSWGDGTAAVNYLGPDTQAYQIYYSLERSEQLLPWDNLVRVANKLNNTSLTVLWDTLENHLDVDRTLWMLAAEIGFSDRASYARKGKDDYMLYQEAESGRMTALELDGRTTMRPSEVAWSPFQNASDVNYPLLNKLLSVPELRQRYLAHLRTLINEKMNTAAFNAMLAAQIALIDAAVQSDPRKLYTYAEYQAENQALQEYITGRRLFLLADGEVAQVAPTITQVEHRVNGSLWASPLATQAVDIRATVTSNNGLSSVRLYYSRGLVGKFTRVTMFDDGLHNDGAANDGVFGASIPATPAPTRVRYYVEAAGDNAARSASYAPPGAEHDVYTYQVAHPTVPSPSVRLNEVMALNNSTAMDNYGDFDDWIELFNTTGQPFDLTGHWLSDDGANLMKWQFPGGSVIGANGYMIIWADDDLGQGDGHANFRLSSNGDEVWLSTPQGIVMDIVYMGPQMADMGFARVPNGTGPFLIQAPTFNANNGQGNSVPELSDIGMLQLFPNPAQQQVVFRSDKPMNVVVHDALMRRVWEGRVYGWTNVDVSGWADGSYFVQHAGAVLKLMVLH